MSVNREEIPEWPTRHDTIADMPLASSNLYPFSCMGIYIHSTSPVLTAFDIGAHHVPLPSPTSRDRNQLHIIITMKSARPC